MTKEEFKNRMLKGLREMREEIWLKDIPHPATPDHEEWNETIQDFLIMVDSLIEEAEDIG